MYLYIFIHSLFSQGVIAFAVHSFSVCCTVWVDLSSRFVIIILFLSIQSSIPCGKSKCCFYCLFIVECIFRSVFEIFTHSLNEALINVLLEDTLELVKAASTFFVPLDSNARNWIASWGLQGNLQHRLRVLQHYTCLTQMESQAMRLRNTQIVRYYTHCVY